MCTYLQRRGNRYFIRRAVPAGLRVAYGRREVTRALGTSNYAEAKARCRVAAVEIDDEFRTIADALLGTQSATHDDLRQGTADTRNRRGQRCFITTHLFTQIDAAFSYWTAWRI